MASRILSRLSPRGGGAAASRLFRTAPPPLLRLRTGRPSLSGFAATSPIEMNMLLSGLRNYTWSNHWFSSSASPQPTQKAANETMDHDYASQGATEVGTNESVEANGDFITSEGSCPESTQSKSPHIRKRKKITKRTAFSDSDTECDLSFDDLVKLVVEKEELLKIKHKEVKAMEDKVISTYADMENVIDRTKREAENSKKFAIQNFAKDLLDVADNLGRASSVVKDSFSKIDSSKDSVGAVPLIKTLLEGVEMTDKQLAEVFRKFGVEKFDPVNEQFDPNRHYALFKIPDASKPPGTVAAVLKPGYMLHDRIIRPAEVGVTESLNDAGSERS